MASYPRRYPRRHEPRLLVPVGSTREQAHAAAATLAASAADATDAVTLLRCCGLLADPEVTRAYLSDGNAHPMGARQ
jgi:hypothetical protein